MLASSPKSGVASADGHLGDPIPTDAVCANVASGCQPFTDIAADTFRFDICCLRYGGVAFGVTASTYAQPTPSPVTRWRRWWSG